MSVIPEDDVLSWAESLPVPETRPKKKDPVDSTAAVLDEEFTALGYPGTARLSILGDVGRENNWDRNTIFKGHSDPKNQSYNRGIISWQGDRRTALDNFLKKEGVLGRNDDEELRGMARFMDKELREKFPDVHQTLLSPKSTYDASEALRRYIKYVPDAPYNSPDPEFRVKNNAEWAKRARKLGLGQELDLNAIWGDVDSVLTDPETVWNEVEAVVDDKPIVTPTPTVPGQKPLIAPGQPLVPDPNDVPTQQAQDEPIDTTRLTRDIGELEKLGTAIKQGVEYGAPQIAPRVPRPVVQQPVTRNKRYVGEEPVISDVDEPTTNLTQANVTREGLYDAVALTIDYPEGADPEQYVIQELKRRFPEGDFSKFELLDRHEGAIGAVVTYGALKDAGIDLTGEEVARQRTETPTPDLSLRGAPIFSESSESEADLREKFRKEEIAKYTDPTTLDFWLYNLTSSPFTRASDVFSPPTKESIEKTVEERINAMPSAGEGRRATETYNPEADFPLATVPARLGSAAYKGFVVDNFAPFLETGGIAQSAFKRYVLGDKTSEAKDTDLFKSGQVMRQTHEQGLPKGTGGIDEKFARGLGQAAGTIMLMAATGGLGGAARTGAAKVATSALDEIAIGASGIADNIAKSTLKTAAGKMLNPQMLRGAVVGVAQQASQAYEMAKSKGATEDQAMLASLLSAPGGFVEGLSESTLVQKLTRIQKLDAISDGLFSKGLMGKAKEIAKTGHSVGVSELWEEMLQGVNSEAAKAVYESRDFKTFSQDIDKSVRDSLLAYPIGFVIGGAGAIGQEIGTREPEAKEKVETFPQTGIWFNERKGTEHPVTVTRVVGVGQRTGETIYETDSGEHILESEFRPDQQKVDLPSNKKAPKTKAETPTGDLVSKEIPPADVESGVSDDVSGDTEEGARIISREVPIGDLVMGQDTTEFIYSPAKPQPPAKDAGTQETKAPSPDTSPIRSRTREKVKGLIGKKIAPADVESSASGDVSGEAKVASTLGKNVKSPESKSTSTLETLPKTSEQKTTSAPVYELTADEYAQRPRLYHGTPTEIEGGKLKRYGRGGQDAGGLFFTQHRPYAEGYGSVVYEIDPESVDFKTFDVRNEEHQDRLRDGYLSLVGTEYETEDDALSDFENYLNSDNPLDWSQAPDEDAVRAAGFNSILFQERPGDIKGQDGEGFEISGDPIYSIAYLDRAPVQASQSLHREAVERALESGDLTPARARELGHFKAYPELEKKFGATSTARDTRKTQETKDDISPKPSRSPALEARKQRAADRKAERMAAKPDLSTIQKNDKVIHRGKEYEVMFPPNAKGYTMLRDPSTKAGGRLVKSESITPIGQTKPAVKAQQEATVESAKAIAVPRSAAKRYSYADEVADQIASPEFKKAEAQSAKETESLRTGFTKTQTEWLAKALQDYAKSYPEGAEYAGKSSELKGNEWGWPRSWKSTNITEPETIAVPDDGVIRITDLQQANRLHQKITGKPLKEGLPKENTNRPRTNAEILQDEMRPKSLGRASAKGRVELDADQKRLEAAQKAGKQAAVINYSDTGVVSEAEAQRIFDRERGGAKPAWQLTKEEYFSQYPERDRQRLTVDHHNAVYAALLDEKAVPADVRAEYPEFNEERIQRHRKTPTVEKDATTQEPLRAVPEDVKPKLLDFYQQAFTLPSIEGKNAEQRTILKHLKQKGNALQALVKCIHK